MDRLETKADNFLSCHIPIQEALPSLFSQGKAFLADYRREVQRRRDLAVGLLREEKALHFHAPQGGFYLTLAVDPKIRLDEEEFVIRLMEEEGVFVHPGYFYDDESGTHLVISFLTQQGDLKEGVGRLRKFLHSVQY
ncbi:MAG: aminotransferase class I/II-fold pyridoxal phosphate-dependent enzyme [Deltaproteobacteria bacterium]|nr:aminotransferase class I/II-fold pyridoxal phosphate-dependent enzyme [Deltaproteobacteria bacterium]